MLRFRKQEVPAFIEEVNRRNEGVVAEFVKIGSTRMDEPCPYTVIIDRISHEVPYYRLYLKYAVLQGVTVVNNPFMWTADDKFFEASLATKLGVASPKTVVLPNKEYVPGIVHTESLRNLVYPLDWQGVIDYVGLPCVLKDALGGVKSAGAFMSAARQDPDMTVEIFVLCPALASEEAVPPADADLAECSP